MSFGVAVKMAVKFHSWLREWNLKKHPLSDYERK